MNKELQERFSRVYVVDFEYQELNGNPPVVHCMVAREVFSGQLIRLWLSSTAGISCPIPLGKDVLYVAYFSTSELKSHLSLGWPLPANVLDLFVEFRCLTNGLPLPAGANLLGAMVYFGLSGIAYTEKKTMRELAIRGAPFSNQERRELTDYCRSDVDATTALLPYLMDKLNLGQALLRGRYMRAAARIEHTGIPIDVEILEQLRVNWELIKDSLVRRVDTNYRVFEGNTFKKNLFADYLRRSQISWPLLPSGNLDLKDDIFRAMTKIHPQLSQLRELRKSLSQMRLHKINVGHDGRARTNISPFGGKTGRNQPSTASYIFGSSKWLRSLIKPTIGMGVAYIDFCQQEIGIAGALSGDQTMQEGYKCGDPYLSFAIQAGLAPADATKQSHSNQRNLCKSVVLGVLYGRGPTSLAESIDQPIQMGKELLLNHRRTFPKFWRWSDDVVSHASLQGELWTVFGWYIRHANQVRAPSAQNYPMQANGAEILRLACCYMVEAGIRVCAPVHDAVLIEAPLETLDDQITQARELMARASRDVLEGFELTTDVEIFRYPERYCDEDRGKAFWEMVMEELDRLQADRA